ncbi:MAG: hypothetical protein H6607_04915 [Flavobacteriales bacterium]|nr:hypothetical protein [Flavobacteriales bacterium]
MIWKKLPNHHKLFRKYLSPWYPENDRPKMTRPDMLLLPQYVGVKPNTGNLKYLTNEGLEETKKIFDLMRESYYGDFQNFIEFDKLNLEVIDAIDRAFGEKEVKQLINESDPKKISNSYLILVCEFGLALGDLFVETGKFEWLYSYPYFDSIVVNQETGNAITVFDWAVKKFSSYGLNDGFKAKFLTTIQIDEEDRQKKNKG